MNITCKVVRNEVSVDMHVSRYAKIVEELRVEVTQVLHGVSRKLTFKSKKILLSRSVSQFFPHSRNVLDLACKNLILALSRVLFSISDVPPHSHKLTTAIKLVSDEYSTVLLLIDLEPISYTYPNASFT